MDNFWWGEYSCTYQNRESKKSSTYQQFLDLNKVKMVGNRKSSTDSDFASTIKCQRPVQFSTEKHDLGEVNKLYSDTNDAVNQCTLKRCRCIKHDKKKKIKRKKT